jgi:hypothetical protein
VVRNEERIGGETTSARKEERIFGPYFFLILLLIGNQWRILIREG